MPRLKAVALLSLATVFSPAAALLGQGVNSARPGTLNYVEGQVSIDGQSVRQSAVGSAAVNTGRVIATGNGRAEVLLTPGVFLRVGENSAVTMISPDLTRTEVKVDRGRADVEVDRIYKQNRILVDEDGTRTRLLKNGLYAFNAGDSTLQVFSGKAAVLPEEDQGKAEIVKGGRELAFNGEGIKPQKFDKKAAENGLYQWSSLRSEYLGEANQQLAGEYAGTAGIAPGWLWDPGLLGYTWLPGDGAFFSPFGYGFYSPLAFNGGYGGYGYPYGGYGGYGYPYGGYGYRGIYQPRAVSRGPLGIQGRPVWGFRGPGGAGRVGGFHGGFHGGSIGGFHGGSVGGFHGGGVGGFHGGGRR